MSCNNRVLRYASDNLFFWIEVWYEQRQRAEYNRGQREAMHQNGGNGNINNLFGGAPMDFGGGVVTTSSGYAPPAVPGAGLTASYSHAGQDSQSGGNGAGGARPNY